jgi:alkylation response protein AidB-like acyl-CoA dehydrogenase
MLFSQGISVSKEASMAKLLATEICCQVSDEALQLCGNDGYMSECPIQRYWRDNRFYPIGGGTSEVMKDIIARCLGIGKKRWER